MRKVGGYVSQSGTFLCVHAFNDRPRASYIAIGADNLHPDMVCKVSGLTLPEALEMRKPSYDEYMREREEAKKKEKPKAKPKAKKEPAKKEKKTPKKKPVLKVRKNEDGEPEVFAEPPKKSK